MAENSEIVDPLSFKEVVTDGAIFDLKAKDPSYEDDQDIDCTKALQRYLKLDCLDSGTYDGEEPFTTIAKDMQNLLQNGKIKKKIIREGYGSKPEYGAKVTINYNAYIQYEAQPFDSTYARNTSFSFITGQGEVIEGLEIAVLSMKINEKSQFLIDPSLAYRDSGMNRIPPNSLVLFEIVLGEIRESSNQDTPEVNEKEFKHAYPQCVALCAKGKNMVRLKDFQGAIKTYSTAINKLEDAILEDYDEQTKSEELLVRLYTNLLVCCVHAEIPKKGCLCAQKIYEMAKNNTFKVSPKVYFNHSKCQKMLGNFPQAERFLMQAKRLEPTNSEINQEIANIRRAKNEYKKQQTKFGRALVGA